MKQEQPISSSAPQADYPPARVGWTAVAVLFLFTVLSVLDRNLLTLLVGPIKADLGLSDVQLSLLYGLAFAIFYAVMGLPSGWMIDRFQRRVVIFWGVVVWSFATLATGFARTYGTLFAARAVVGAGEAVLVPGSHSIIGDLFPREKMAMPMSVSALGIKVGQGLALLIGGALTTLFVPDRLYALPLVGELMGWHLIFIVVGAPGILLAFLIFLIPEPRRRIVQRPTHIAEKPAGFAVYLRFVQRHLRFYVSHHLGILLYGMTALSVIAWTPAYLGRTHGWPENQIGLWLGTALLLGTCGGMPLHGYLADRFFQRGVTDIHLRYTALSALVGWPLGVAAFLVSNPYLAIVLIGLMFFAISTYGGLSIVAVQAIVPSDLRGKASSIMLLIIGMGGTILGPLIVALLTDYVFRDPARVGDAILLCVALGLPITALVLSFSLAPNRTMIAEARARDGAHMA
ncbi:Sugar phosphate permease [Sphingobium faniae]|nr:Sugar phosphate permease [Sphingobium faniae]